MAGLMLPGCCVAGLGPDARAGPGAQVTWISLGRWYTPGTGVRDYGSVASGCRLPGSIEVREGAGYFLHPAGASQRRYEALRAYFTEDMPASEVADRSRAGEVISRKAPYGYRRIPPRPGGPAHLELYEPA